MTDCVVCLPKKLNYIFNEIPIGPMNCQNVTFFTNNPFDPSTLIIRLDGVTLDPNQVIINSGNQSFDLVISSTDPKHLNSPPSSEEILRVDYQILTSSSCLIFL